MAHDDLALSLWRAPPAASRTATRLVLAGLATLAFASLSLVPLAVAAPIGIVAMLGLVASEVGAARTGRVLLAHGEWRQRDARRSERESALQSAGCGRELFRELDRLVASIEVRDPELARRLDLQALLDRQVALAIAHHHALRALAMADRMQLQRICDEHRADPEHDPRRLELAERRLHCHQECEAQAQSLADELAIVADAIRLMAQRAARPDELPADDTIERCLAELDGRDAANRTLVAELS